MSTGGGLNLAGINFSYFHEPEGDFLIKRFILIFAPLNLAFWALLANIAKFNTRS